MIYSCERCGYSSEYKSNLRNHFKRKKACKPILSTIDFSSLLEKFNQSTSSVNNVNKNVNNVNKNVNNFVNNVNKNVNNVNNFVNNFDNVNNFENPNNQNYICKFCNKVFKHRQSKYLHEKRHCKLRNSDVEKSDLLKYIENMEEDKKSLKKYIELLLVNVGSNNNNTYISNKVNMQQNIYINNYGQENLDYIGSGYMNNLVNIPFRSVQNLVKDIHFNPNHPENHNVKIPNRKEKFAIVYKNGEWEFRNKKDVIETLVDNSYNMIDLHFENNKLVLEDNKKKRFIDFQNKFESDDKTKRDIELEIELDILNNQGKVEAMNIKKIS